MIDLITWHNEVIGRRVVDALNKNKFSANYFEQQQEAVSYILQLVPDNTTIGVGGSRTTLDLGLVEILEKRGHQLFNHNQAGLTPDERVERRYKQLTCDVFLAGANAITLAGEIINRDAFGNRVAAMMFGPKRVIIVAGINKVVRNVEEADNRIKMHAAPLNNKKYELPNPCVQVGECMDCQGATRSCNITTILSKCPPLTDIHVVIIGGMLGF